MSGLPVMRVRLSLRLPRHRHWHGDLKVPPDWYWRWRYCSRGTCAYGNFWCPNGCPEYIDVDDILDESSAA